MLVAIGWPGRFLSGWSEVLIWGCARACHIAQLKGPHSRRFGRTWGQMEWGEVGSLAVGEGLTW